MNHESTAPRPPAPARIAAVVLGVSLLAAVLAAVPSPLFDLDRHSVPKELVLHLAALAAAPLCLLAARGVCLGWVDLALGGFLALGGASALAAPNPWLATRSLALVASGAAVFWAARFLAARGLARPLLVAAALATVLASLTALAQAYGLDTPLFATARAPGGTFGNRNFMAHLLAIGLPALILTAAMSRSRWRWALGLAGVGAVAAALLLSRTRAAWLAVALSAAFAGLAVVPPGELRRAPRLLRRAGALLLAAAVGVALAAAVPNELDWRSRSPYLDTARDVVNYREGSGKGRLIQYRNTLSMVLDHPFLGVGPGNWPLIYPHYASRRDPSLSRRGTPTNPWPSSDWVGFLAETGPLAFGCLAAVGLCVWKSGWRVLRRGAPGSDPPRALALLCTVVAAVTVGAFDAALHLGAPTLLFWTVAGALLPAQPALWRAPLGPRARRALAGGALLLAGLLVFRSAGQTAALLVAGDGWQLADLERASRLDPGNHRLHLLLAQNWSRRGRCDKARPHAQAAADQLPYAPEPRRLLEACGGARR